MNTKYFLFIACVVFLATACNPKFYVPNTHNVPMLSEKGDGNIMVAGNGNQYEFQASYGLSDNLGVMLNTGFFRPADLANDNGGSGNVYEAGIGYYKHLSPSVNFEAYGLFGLGNMENHLPSTLFDHPMTTGNISADVSRFGVQPMISWRKNRLSVALSARLMSLSYRNIEGSLIFDFEDQVAFLEDNSSVLLIEPALTFRAQLVKNFSVQFQTVLSENIGKNSSRQDNVLMSVGLNYSFIADDASDN